MKYKVGTRESKLALIQAKFVCKELVRANSDLSLDQFELVKIKTIGDKILNKNLVDIGGKNLFIKEIEEALLKGEIDFAVHSLKDMTANLDKNFTIAACLKREDPRDAFISYKYKSLNDLPQGALLGTSSVRRKSIALHKRPDLAVVPFRGNVLTRLDKLKNNQVDATFLAVAGLKRLGIDDYYPLEIDEFLPPVSQGVIGVECRADDQKTAQLLRSINHIETEICNNAERSFLEYMEADCSVPISGYATLADGKISLSVILFGDNGKIYKTSVKGKSQDAKALGIEAGKEIKRQANSE